MSDYSNKLQHQLIDIGKAVENAQGEPTPTIPEMEVLYDKVLQAFDKGDMKAMAVASKELLVALMKWRMETL